MAKNTFLSAGVYTREFDLSFYQKEIPAVGAAVIGQTVRGQALVPTPVSTYSEYLRWYGDIFSSGSGQFEREFKYLTTYTVQEYLRWGEIMTVVRVLAGDYRPPYTNILSKNGADTNASGSNDMSFKLIALSDGETLNSGRESAALYGKGVAGDEVTGGTLVSGSRYNIRWEVANVDTDRGTFDLYIRRGDDNDFRRVIMEQYSGLTLDARAGNYIGRVIGDQTYSLYYDSGGTPYLQLTGSYPTRSRYVRVADVKQTLNYIQDDGTVRDIAMTGSLPAAFNTTGSFSISGTFAYGSDGLVSHPRAMYGDIWNNNTQGFNLAVDDYQTPYLDAIDILSNKDQFDFDLLFTPGLIDNLEDHARVITRAISMVEDRGDAFYVIDPTYKGSTVGQAQIAAESRNSNYAGYYYPWCQVSDPDLGGNFWVPPSAVISGVFAFNDYVGEKWNAPAGLNRGGLDTVIQTERIMTKNDRDNLYIKNVNPLATFPRNGVVVWGQKTLQKKQSALDRINVRRLLIAAKRHVAEVAKVLLFEPNTEKIRTDFVNLTTPWFESCRRKQGLYDFRIIMDERNNTADVIDRNEMRASIYLKPAKTAEFIIADFMVLPTGAIFPMDNTV